MDPLDQEHFAEKTVPEKADLPEVVHRKIRIVPESRIQAEAPPIQIRMRDDKRDIGPVRLADGDLVAAGRKARLVCESELLRRGGKIIFV
jgi:hypothetical protein